MITAFFVFLFVFIITYVFIPFAVSGAINFIDKENSLGSAYKFILALGISPFLVSLILYYLLWLLPNQHPAFYFGIICIAFFVMTFLFHSPASKLYWNVFKWERIIQDRRSGEEVFFRNRLFEIRNGRYSVNYFNVFVISGLCVTFYHWLKTIVGVPFTGHDMLEYAIQAKYFATHRIIEYTSNRFHPENSFYYVGLHGFSFPLLGTWEYLFSSLFDISDNDYLYRSITGYYGILLVLSIAVHLSKVSKALTIYLILIMLLSYGFYLTLTSYHIDTYRMFFITNSFILLAYTLKNENSFTKFLLALCCGAGAFIHSLGVFIAVFLVLSYFMFAEKEMKQRLICCIKLTLIIILTGGIHYLMDVWKGTGWIFQEIQYY
jgi:hypothetical protein